MQSSTAISRTLASMHMWFADAPQTERSSIRVEDGGHGFDTHKVADPTTPENRCLPYGRGIHLMRMSMDEIGFEQSGTVVYMRKGPT